jgi:G:T-mismatch repair DNA endonuclease (very short patch repair protein)
MGLGGSAVAKAMADWRAEASAAAKAMADKAEGGDWRQESGDGRQKGEGRGHPPLPLQGGDRADNGDQGGEREARAATRERGPPNDEARGTPREGTRPTIRKGKQGDGSDSAGYPHRTRASSPTIWKGKRYAANDRRSQTAATVRIDFVFRRERVVVFVDGCFWHGCPVHSEPARWLRRSTMRRAGGSAGASPSKLALRTGKAFWAGKMAGNIARDKFVTRKLRRDGWTVVRLWEHELAKRPERCLQRIKRVLR